MKNASEGDTVTITVSPEPGYELDTLTVKDADGKEVAWSRVDGSSGDVLLMEASAASGSVTVAVVRYTFKMPKSNVTISATFKKSGTVKEPESGGDTYSLTIGEMEHGNVEASPTSSVAKGVTVTLTVSPEPGYKLDALTVTDAGGNPISTTEVTAGTSYTFSMPRSNVRVSATFKVASPVLKAAPDAVGDIVFNDGTAVSGGTGVTLTDEQKAAAVAVIFLVEGTKKLGVGLNQGTSLTWAKIETTGCITEFGTSEANGSGNWDVIKVADSTGAAAAATNYPAFNFANTYGVSVAGNADGWYLPAKEELKNLCDSYRASGSAVKEALDKCTGTINLSTGCFWSSSQSASNIGSAGLVDFGSGNPVNFDKTDRNSVCAVRAF